MVDQTQEINKKNSWALLPLDMQFNDGHVVSIATYSVIMVISGVANITVLILLWQRRRRSRNSSMINTMLMNLAIADLIVTFLMMPLEIGWNATVSWRAGDFLCRAMAFFRIFGLYLSGFVLMSISIDRYYAVMRPLSLAQLRRRGRYMLIAAWSASLIFSAPQMAIFHVEQHPNFTHYSQCVTFNFFQSPTHDLLYKYFGLVMMYGLPLAVIIFCYSSILLEIYKRYRDCYYGTDVFRRPSAGFLGRARIRTFKMTLTIVLGFIVCWTPYYVMCLWYWMDTESAKKVDQKIQKGLFIFASANSIMNPLVYGFFNVRTTPQNVAVAVSKPPMSVIPDVIIGDARVSDGRDKSGAQWRLHSSFSSDKNGGEDVGPTQPPVNKKIKIRRFQWQLRTQRSFSSEGTDIADAHALEEPATEVFEDVGRPNAEARRQWWRRRAQQQQAAAMENDSGQGWRSWLSHEGRGDLELQQPPSPWKKWLTARQPSKNAFTTPNALDYAPGGPSTADVAPHAGSISCRT